MEDGLTDATMVKYFRITQEKLDEMKELIVKYPDSQTPELAEIYMEQQQPEDAAAL